MRIANLFRHSNVEKTSEQPTSITVLKEARSKLMTELDRVAQKAEDSPSMNLSHSVKITDCYNKINRESDRIVINAKKFQKTHYAKYRAAIVVDGSKLNRHVNDFIDLTSRHNVESHDLGYSAILINDAIKSSTSTRTGNGIDFNKGYKTLAECFTPQG